jgi:hypothetical protein
MQGEWGTFGRNALIAKLDAASGELGWVRPVTGFEHEASATQLAVSSNGDVVAALQWTPGTWSLEGGSTIHTSGGVTWLALDVLGAESWWQQAEVDEVYLVKSTALRQHDDGLLATFWTEGVNGAPGTVHLDGTALTNPARHASYVVDLDSDGAVRSAEALQISAALSIWDAVPAGCGDVVLAGDWVDPLDMGDGSLGDNGAFVWRRAANGDTRWFVSETGDRAFVHLAIDAAGQATVSGGSEAATTISRFAVTGERLWDVDIGAA